MSKLQSAEELKDILTSILADPKACKEALVDPSKVLADHGVTIPDPEIVNENFFDTNPTIRTHFVLGAAGKHEDPEYLGCSSVKCIACKTALTTGGAAAIVALIAAWPEDGVLVEAVAELCGLDAEEVEELFKELAKDGLHFSGVVSALCKKMGAC